MNWEGRDENRAEGVREWVRGKLALLKKGNEGERSQEKDREQGENEATPLSGLFGLFLAINMTADSPTHHHKKPGTSSAESELHTRPHCG